MKATEEPAIDGGTPVREAPYDTAKGHGLLSGEEIEAVVEVMRSRSLFRYYGPDLLGRTEAFERELAELTGAEHAVATSSGTAALQAALVGLGVSDGDEVVVPAVTFIATVGAVVSCRAVPVFCEIDESLNLDPGALSACITEKTAAVVPVHLFNVPCDMDPILEVCGRHDVPVLEDAAQAIGTSYRGRRAGAIGDAGAFSLQLEKNVTAGEGGALVTSDWDVYDRAVRYQDQGGQFTTSRGEDREHTSGPPFLGVNLRMSELAGAIASVQLGRLDGMLETMRRRAAEIRDGLADVPVDWRRLPDPDGTGGDATMLLPTAETARGFGRALRAEGIPAGRPYGGQPVYANPAILERRTPWDDGCPWHCEAHPTDREYAMGMCPRAEDLIARTLVVGLGARMTAADAEDVVTAVRKVAGRLL